MLRKSSHRYWKKTWKVTEVPFKKKFLADIWKEDDCDASKLIESNLRVYLKPPERFYIYI